jgi:hypothetical protein
MSTQLPGIGRNGLINAVRRLSGMTNPGYRNVDPTAEFVAGMVANLEADSDGNPVLTVANASDTGVIGLFFCHKVNSFYRPIIDEAQTFGTSPNTSAYLFLNHANLKGAAGTYVKITNAAGVAYTYTTDYTVNYTNGTVLRTSAGTAPGATATVYVSYVYEDASLTGIDQTMGSGKAATLEDEGEVATLLYTPNSATAYTMMCPLYANADGYVTATDGGGSHLGVLTKLPTASDPELHFKLKIV